MKRIVLLCLFLLLLVPSADAADQPELRYFYQNICEACDAETELAETLYLLAEQDITAYDYTLYNVLTESGKAAYLAALKQFAIPQEEQGLPFLIIGDQYYTGQNAIYSAFSSVQLVDASGQDSVIYYVYLPACESCAEAKKVLDTLPAAVTVYHNGMPLQSKVSVIAVDMSCGLGAAQQLFRQYQVPEDEQTAPAVFLGNDCLLGGEAIASALPQLVLDGMAVGTPMVNEAGADTSALSVAGSFIAGLIGGVNPCALSMLLLFLSIIIQLNVRAVPVTAVFLSAKGVTYLAIGTVLLSLLSKWNLQWLPLLAKWVMTVVALALLLLNGWDALQALKGRYGRIKNQLPGHRRSALQNRIKTVLEGKRRSLLFAAAGLGVTVAAGEFLCAGQMYLAAILAAIRLGSGMGYLVVFCAGFLLPSAVLSALVLRSRSTFEATRFLRERLPLVKLISSVFFLLMLILIWVV